MIFNLKLKTQKIMKLTILAFGDFGRSPEKLIYDDFIKRMKCKIILKELHLKNSKNISSNDLKAREGELILSNIEHGSTLIVLDEKGKEFTSVEFAKLMHNYALNAISNLTFIIGGADGLSSKVIEKANIVLSLSKMTIPHILVRIFLIEQLYRAQSINSNHPYHRY
jgi:23S rRNA (pseudouridine1915-N3)-methyltransferase